MANVFAAVVAAETLCQLSINLGLHIANAVRTIDRQGDAVHKRTSVAGKQHEGR